jgi:hypothetical protein
VSVDADELVEPDGAELELALDPDLSADVEPLPVLPDDAALDGVLGEVLEPAPAEPLLTVAEPDIEVPPDGDAVEPDGAALEDEDDEPDGEVGAAVEPVEDEELEPDGAVLVVPPREAGALSLRSHAVRRLAPKATDTATARVESFMEPP